MVLRAPAPSTDPAADPAAPEDSAPGSHAARLGRLLRPRSIAVMGGAWAGNVLRTLRAAGFDGAVWPVHPTRDEIEGYACHRSLADLPAAPDATFIGVNRDATIAVARELSAMGAGGAVCFASGWSEVADGAERQRALIEAAGAMPVLGPNCYGFINYLDGAMLWPDVHGGVPVDRGVALIAQSSNIAINLTMQRRGLPLAYLLTVGNAAQTTVADMIEALLDDPRVTGIGLHLEGFGDPAPLAAALGRARAQGVPVVAMKVGASAAAQAMTMSHTATLAGADDLASAFLARCGVARVATPEEMVETLKLLHVLGPSPDRTIGSMSCSGGEASLVADLAAAAGLDMAPLPEPAAEAVRATVNSLVTVSNPFDYHTFDWNDEPRMTATWAAFLGARFGLTLLLMDIPRGDRCPLHGWEGALRAVFATRAAVPDARLAFVTTLPESLPEPLAADLMAAGIAPLQGLAAALTAARHAADLGAPRIEAEPLAAQPRPDPDAPVATLDEADSKAMLAPYGLALPASLRADTAQAAADAAEELGFPVVLKAVSPDLPHKTEAGAVALNLRDPAAVRAAADGMAALGAPFLVERMVAGGVAELITGISRDPVFGLTMTIGAGGVLVELLADAAALLLPATRDELRAAILSLRSAPLLAGHRGRPAGDVEAVIDAAMAVQAFALDHAARLEELDINPLIVTPGGAVAADALIRIRPEEAAP